jgi:hypothetical protein
MTTIKAKKTLYNGGRCFTKGKTYETSKDVKTEAGLIEATVTNDLGEPHIIGMWWRQFEIIK